MSHYIQRYIDSILAIGHFPTVHMEELYKELDRLDPRDFVPAVQSELVLRKVHVRRAMTGHFGDDIAVTDLLSKIIELLDNYQGQGSGGIVRAFPYIADLGLRTIIERDYRELSQILFPGAAWKSCVIMAGSILEAVLFDRLNDPKRIAAAIASPEAKDKKGKFIPPDDWRLENLIDISLDIKMLPRDPANTIHQVIRDYRNFVHPKKEIRASHACTEAEGMLSFGALESVCNYLEKNP